jgi:hypothetical protein
MLYWSDDGDLMALRYARWKVIFQEQRAEGLRVWSEPFVRLRWPMLSDLRSDPFEKAALGSIDYSDWAAQHVPARTGTSLHGEVSLQVQEFPPRQKPASFSID